MSSPVRLLFKSIEEGDLKKIEARSNITPSGGGARDLRLPHRPLEKAINKMFPRVVHEGRTRDKQRTLVDVLRVVRRLPGRRRGRRKRARGGHGRRGVSICAAV